MQLRWTEEAANDLEHIADYLLLHSPDRAQELIQRIYDAPSSLLTLPNRGRPGKLPGTREHVLSPLPYVVVYAVRGEVVFVIRILHGAQRWP
jgi:toxin ParE1/3/4